MVAIPSPERLIRIAEPCFVAIYVKEVLGDQRPIWLQQPQSITDSSIDLFPLRNLTVEVALDQSKLAFEKVAKFCECGLWIEAAGEPRLVATRYVDAADQCVASLQNPSLIHLHAPFPRDRRLSGAGLRRLMVGDSLNPLAHEPGGSTRLRGRSFRNANQSTMVGRPISLR